MEPIALQCIQKLFPDIKYSPYQIPPDLQLCEIHYRATTFGQTIRQSAECPCCWEKEKMKLPLCCKQNRIAEIEPTTAYFFFVVKTLVLMIISVILVYGIFTFTSTVSTCKNEPNKCVEGDFFFFKVPFLKVTDQTSPTYKTLSILTLTITILYIILLQYLLLRKQNKYMNMIRPADYTILLSGVDHQKIKQADIIEFFKKEDVGQIQILYTHKIGRYLEAERKKALIKTKVEYCLQKGLTNQDVQKYKQQIKMVEEQLYPIINKFYFNQEESIRTDKVFVSFEHFQDKDKIVGKYKQGALQRTFRTLVKRPTSICINGTYLSIEEIAQPNQILWGNLEITSYSRIIRIFIGNLITMVLLGVAFALILVLSHFEIQQADSSLDKFYSYLCAMGITSVNLGLSYLVHYIAKKQRRFTVPGVTSSLMVKQTISFFISTALMPVSMFFIYAYRPEVDNLISNVISIFTFNSFITSITILFTLDSIYKYYKRTRILAKSILITQYQANQYFEKSEFEVDFKFALVTKLGFLALFYGGAFPIGLVVSIIGLSIYYWTIKFLLVKHTKIIDTSFKIPKRMNRLLCMLPVVFTSGELINEILINSKSTVFNLVLFLLSIFLSLLLFSYSRHIVKKLMKKYGSLVLIQKPTRSEAIRNGMVDYKHVNPTSYQQRKHEDLNKKPVPGLMLETEEGGRKMPRQIVSLSMYITKNPLN